MGAYGRGYARGAQPYARLRWQEPWGVGMHARGQRSRCRAFGGLRRSASMRVHASAPKPQKGRDTDLGARATCEPFVVEREWSSVRTREPRAVLRSIQA